MGELCQGQCDETPAYVQNEVATAIGDSHRFICPEALTALYIKLFGVMFWDARGCDLSYEEQLLGKYELDEDDRFEVG